MTYTFSKIFPEVAIIQPYIFTDYRGEYIETWNLENYKIFNKGNIIFKQARHR